MNYIDHSLCRTPEFKSALSFSKHSFPERPRVCPELWHDLCGHRSQRVTAGQYKSWSLGRIDFLSFIHY